MAQLTTADSGHLPARSFGEHLQQTWAAVKKFHDRCTIWHRDETAPVKGCECGQCRLIRNRRLIKADLIVRQEKRMAARRR